jgi:segregation and condensation protein B
MAFNLKLVLKALLFSSNQPLTIKDIQAVFTRFHEKAQAPASAATEGGDAAEVPADDAEVAAAALNPVEGAAEAGIVEGGALSLTPEDNELYGEVPSLITSTQIREAMDALAAELRAENDIYLLIDGASGYRLVTHPRFARWIRILRDEPPPVKLSQSALETLAVVAYRQPVTRSELEAIRGVSAEAGLNRLLEREMIYVVGRADLPGRPLQYGTTDKFLEFVGVKSLVELPASDVLSPRQIDEWLNHTANVPSPSDAEMGLPLEEGEGASPSFDAVTLEHSVPATESAAPEITAPDATPSPPVDAPPESADSTPKPQPSTDNA